MSPKHADGPYAEGRALAIVGDPLAARLIDSARKKQVVDLSVVLSTDLPVVVAGARRRQSSAAVFEGAAVLRPQPGPLSRDAPARLARRHAPGAAGLLRCRRPASTTTRTAPEVHEWLAEYEQKYGPRGTSDVTTEKVPLAQTCGPARVIDVKHRIGTTEAEELAAIARDHGRRHPTTTKRSTASCKPGDIVIFHSGYSDAYYKPLPRGLACMADPLDGKREGWPAPGPDAIVYLAEQGHSLRGAPTDRRWAAPSPSEP